MVANKNGNRNGKGKNKTKVGASANVTANMPGFEGSMKASSGYGHVDFLAEVANTKFDDIKKVDNTLYVIVYGGVREVFMEYREVFNKFTDEKTGGAKLKLIVVDTNSQLDEHDFPAGTVYIDIGEEYGINGLKGTIQPKLLDLLTDRLIEKFQNDETLCNNVLWKPTKDQKQFKKPHSALMVLGGAGGTGSGALWLSKRLDNIGRPHLYVTLFGSNAAGSLNKHKYLLTGVMEQAQITDGINYNYNGQEIIYERPSLSAACIDTAVNGKEYARAEVAAMTTALLLMMSSTSADISDIDGYAGGSSNNERENVCDIKIVYGTENEVTEMDLSSRHSSLQYTPTGDDAFETTIGNKVTKNPHDTITNIVSVVAITHNAETLEKRIEEYTEAIKKLTDAAQKKNTSNLLSKLTSMKVAK